MMEKCRGEIVAKLQCLGKELQKHVAGVKAKNLGVIGQEITKLQLEAVENQSAMSLEDLRRVEFCLSMLDHTVTDLECARVKKQYGIG